MRDVAAERLELHLTYRCTSRCVFCSEEGRMRAFRDLPVRLGHVVAVLREHVPRGIRHLHLTGGEPTLHPDLVRILDLARALGVRTSLGSNGWRLARPSFAEPVLARLDELVLSLHGPDAATHDALARATGSFDRVVRALDLARGGHVAVNTLLLRDNRDRVVETARFARDRGARMLLVSAVSPEGAAEPALTRLTVPLDAVAPIAEAVVHAVGDDLTVRFFGLPPCALGTARAHANDLYFDPRITVEWERRPGRVVMAAIASAGPDRGRAHVAACAGCAWSGVCPGPFRGYVEALGTAGIAPIGGSVRGVNAPHP